MVDKKDKKPIFEALKIPLLLLGFMWVAHLANIMLDLNLGQYGIYPRKVFGLRGILFSPLIHSSKDFAHIVNNSTPLFILGWSLFYFYRRIAWSVMFISWVGVGILVWLAARSNFHIGMSGVIYALAFFLFFSGVFRKEVKLMAISLFVVFLYGGMVWGVLPIDMRVSYESHAAGGIMGIILAYVFKKHGATFEPKKYNWEREEELEEEMKRKGYQKIVDPESGFTVGYGKEKPPEESDYKITYHYKKDKSRE